VLPGNVVAVPGRVAAAIIALPGFTTLRARARGTNYYEPLMSLYRLGLENSVPPDGTSDIARAVAAPNWLTTEQASEFLGIGQRAVVKRLSKGQLGGHKVARRWRVDRQHVEALIQPRT
jgi:excisionase family DNA binding protein